MKVAREHNAFFIRNKIDGNQLAIAKEEMLHETKKKKKLRTASTIRKEGTEMINYLLLKH